MLRKKAAEELKKEQERKAAERRRIIEERCGSPRNLTSASEGKIPILLNYFLSFDEKKIDKNIHKNTFEKTHYIILHTIKNLQTNSEHY